MIKFTVYGHPVPKARARTVRTKNGKTVSYTPGKTADWENSIRAQALACRPDKLLDGPLALSVTFYLLRPKSRPKREQWPDRRPDLDNLVKSVKDALNGILWYDDAQIVTLAASKRYGEPGVEIAVKQVTPMAKQKSLLSRMTLKERQEVLREQFLKKWCWDGVRHVRREECNEKTQDKVPRCPD